MRKSLCLPALLLAAGAVVQLRQQRRYKNAAHPPG